ncbi:nucleoside hydrolase [Arthrobacter sp. Soil762]|uniref:nucleoside hydrolase n=1 Tax=Arthrobacter sp. Soil762 TaxID=1736401 RepID=UPI0006F828E4|nr:nucleoside hydrolase [Arthrobacter sp. Soil762]KRE72708.1 hydrolase [Arthrobacter sp. Soil762]
MKNILIDCDPGIDDALAIILALKHPNLDVRAVTTVSGNMTADHTSINARKILEFMGKVDIPVAQGPLKPLVRDYPRDPFSHGDDGLGNTGLPQPNLPLDARTAAEVIVSTVNEHAGDISLAFTGPLTNLALALELDPELPSKVSELVFLGGSFGFTKYAFTQATGDNPASEWNVYVDPEAADIVFRAGFPLRCIGLDVATHIDINLSDERLGRLRSSDKPEARLAADIVKFVRDREYQSYCALIDSMVIADLVDPGIVRFEEIYCGVETEGKLTLGMTVADIRNHHAWTDLPRIRAAADADFGRFLDFLVDGLTA